MPYRVVRCWGCLLWALWAAGMAQAGGVLVVSSGASNAGYAQTAQALVAALQQLGVQELAQREAQEVETMDFSGTALPKVVVSLGVEALRQVLNRDLRTPVIAALVPRQSFEAAVSRAGSKTAALTAAVYLDQPVARQLELLRLALPGARRIGVLWGPESEAQQPALQAALRARAMQEVPGYVSGSTPLFEALQSAMEDVQVLLAWPDPKVYNSATVANILLTTYRARVPVMGFSAALVNAGALLSVHSTPQQIGQQAAQMVRTSLQSGLPPGSQYPVEFEVAVNERVAHTLGMELRAADLSERLHKLERKP